MIPALALLLACRVDDPETDLPLRAAMPADEHARRVSLAVRGVPLTPAERAALTADPDSLPAHVDTWLDSPEFAATIRDIHAEFLWTRVDTEFEYPSSGPLSNVPQGEIMDSVGEGPLRLVEDVVMSDRPYTDILAADYTMVDRILSEMYGLDYDVYGPLWQRATWKDGRPAAGLLADNGLWLRYRSADTNFQRERANTVSRAFLCADYASADIPVLDSDELPAQGNGPIDDPACIGCHQVIDPLGSFFWGFDRYVLPQEVRQAYRDGCRGDTKKFCYPFDYYDPARESRWAELGMPAPALVGYDDDTALQDGADLSDLGALVVARAEFPLCTARHFASWLSQTPANELPQDAVARWADALVESGWDAKALVREIVLDPGFSALREEDGGFVAGAQQVRPEQYARTVAALTGFSFMADPTSVECAAGPYECWGVVDLTITDRYGFRTLAGGISAYEVTTPTWTSTPTRELALERIATEAAGWVVRRDLAAPDAEKLLLHASPGTVGEAAVRGEIAALWLALLGEDAGADHPGVNAAFALWTERFRVAGPESAWRTVISALLLHPRMVHY